MKSVVRCLLLFLVFQAGDAAAQVSAQAKEIQDQAAGLLSQAKRCPQVLDKAFIDRFAARATALIMRADGQLVARGPSGEYEPISATLVSAANCKTVQCHGRTAPLQPPNCSHFGPQFRALRINQANWQLNEGLK
jgi:hypothetical protein